MKKIRKKVAFLGGSLPIILFANFYSKLNKTDKVLILDKSKEIGGAWQKFNYKNIKISRHSNIIIPENKIDENKQTKINKFLKFNFNTKIKKLKAEVNTKYVVKNNYHYNFDKLISEIKRKKMIKKININEIKILKNKKVIINNKFNFDRIFLPTFFGLEKIIYLNKHLNIDYTPITSEHIVAITKNNIFKDLYYSDSFNHFFDRVAYQKFKNFNSFTARIVKKYKGSRNKTIEAELEKIFGKKKVIKYFKFKYKNYYRNEQQIDNLKKLNYIKSISLVNTKSFFLSILQIMSFAKNNEI